MSENAMLMGMGGGALVGIVSAEIGLVDAHTIAVVFAEPVQAAGSDFTTGTIITKCGNGIAVTGAALQTTTLLYITIGNSDAFVIGDIGTVQFDSTSLIVSIARGVGVYHGVVDITNNVPIAPPTPWYLSGGISAANCIAAYQPKGAASLAVSYSNLANPGTNDAAPGTAPTWDDVNGWIFNGTSQFLTTGIFPDAGWSWAVLWSNTGTPIATDVFGTADSTDGFSWAPNTSTGHGFYNEGGFVDALNSRTSGVAIATNQKGYYNGIFEKSIGAWSGGVSTFDIRIGGRNGSTPSFRVCNIQALAIYNVSIDSQVAALYAAMAVL